MSDHEHEREHDAGVLFGDDHAAAPRHGTRRRGRRRSGCLPILLVLALVVAGGYVLVRSVDVGNPFAADEAEDFPGPGSGEVVAFEVAAGDTISTMGRNLEDLGVVASTQAYVEAAEADDSSRGIREGVYQLEQEMKAADVVTLLAGATTKGTSFTFTSGKTVEEVVDLLADQTDVGRRTFEAALDKPGSIGLPGSADGNAEGYLSPGSYTFFPEDDATSILSAMVARTVETLEEVDLAGAAERLGYSEHELLTVASLVEAEGSLLDERGKSRIARVIYNRLEIEPNPSAGFLQLDATVNYALGEKFAVLTFDQIDSVADNPYSTYGNKGLPPGPIATPSRASLEAATKPADGPWFYYVTVNLETGETKFAETPEEFSVIEQELRAYCDADPERCGR